MKQKLTPVLMALGIVCASVGLYYRVNKKEPNKKLGNTLLIAGVSMTAIGYYVK